MPALAGANHSTADHPRVFTTAADLQDLAVRINHPGGYSKARFGQLADQIKRDLASGVDWDVTYAGCNPGIYQYAFSYEPQDHHEAEIRTALHLAPDAQYPAGAAVVASRLALYAALLKAGAAPPASAPSADQAAALAKRILVAWADRGFKDAQGRFLLMDSIACDSAGKASMDNAAGSIPWELGRGDVYLVHAQDLLQFIGAVSPPEATC